MKGTRVLGKLWSVHSRQMGWRIGVRGKRRNSQLASWEHLLTTIMGTKGGGASIHRPRSCLPNSHQCGILLFLLILSWSNTRQQHDVLSGAKKGFSNWGLKQKCKNGNICSEDTRKVILMAWGKHLGHTPQTTTGVVNGERLGELMRKEAEWMQSHLQAKEEWCGLKESGMAPPGRSITWGCSHARTKGRWNFHPRSSLKRPTWSRPLGKLSSTLQSSAC